MTFLYSSIVQASQFYPITEETKGYETNKQISQRSKAQRLKGVDGCKSVCW